MKRDDIQKLLKTINLKKKKKNREQNQSVTETNDKNKTNLNIFLFNFLLHLIIDVYVEVFMERFYFLSKLCVFVYFYSSVPFHNIHSNSFLKWGLKKPIHA